MSKVGLLIDGSHFLGVGGGRDVRGELRDQNGPAPCHRTGQFGELAQTLVGFFFKCPRNSGVRKSRAVAHGENQKETKK